MPKKTPTQPHQKNPLAAITSEALNAKLLSAVLSNDTEAASCALKEGADPNCHHGSCLRNASMHGRLLILKMLVKYGADIHAENEQALRTAVRNNQMKSIKYLYEHGADLSAGVAFLTNSTEDAVRIFVTVNYEMLELQNEAQKPDAVCAPPSASKRL